MFVHYPGTCQLVWPTFSAASTWKAATDMILLMADSLLECCGIPTIYLEFLVVAYAKSAMINVVTWVLDNHKGVTRAWPIWDSWGRCRYQY